MTPASAVRIEQDRDGYCIATVPALKSCHTQAKTLDELHARIREVVELCMEKQRPADPKFVGVKFVGLQRLEIAV